MLHEWKKKGLGRGLSALFGDEKPKDKPQEIKQSNTISISDLSRNPYQPRQHFSEEKLEELSNSIKKNGIIQPIAVRPNKSSPGKYEIVPDYYNYNFAFVETIMHCSVAISLAMMRMVFYHASTFFQKSKS